MCQHIGGEKVRPVSLVKSHQLSDSHNVTVLSDGDPFPRTVLPLAAKRSTNGGIVGVIMRKCSRGNAALGVGVRGDNGSLNVGLSPRPYKTIWKLPFVYWWFKAVPGLGSAERRRDINPDMNNSAPWSPCSPARGWCQTTPSPFL